MNIAELAKNGRFVVTAEVGPDPVEDVLGNTEKGAEPVAADQLFDGADMDSFLCRHNGSVIARCGKDDLVVPQTPQGLSGRPYPAVLAVRPPRMVGERCL